MHWYATHILARLKSKHSGLPPPDGYEDVAQLLGLACVVRPQRLRQRWPHHGLEPILQRRHPLPAVVELWHRTHHLRAHRAPVVVRSADTRSLRHWSSKHRKATSRWWERPTKNWESKSPTVVAQKRSFFNSLQLGTSRMISRSQGGTANHCIQNDRHGLCEKKKCMQCLPLQREEFFLRLPEASKILKIFENVIRIQGIGCVQRVRPINVPVG